MQLPDLSPELIDHVFAALLDTIGPVKILRLRVVNHFFSEVILRAVTDSYVRSRNGSFHYWLDKWIRGPGDRKCIRAMGYRRVSPPIMSRFIEAEMKSDLVQHPLSVLREVLHVLNEIEPVSEPEQEKLRARSIYEAAASYLDWDSDHKFASSWPGDIPRRDSPKVDEKKQTLLGAAVIVGTLSTIQKVLGDASIDVNHESPFFGGSLQLAALRGDLAILELLLIHGAEACTIQVQSTYFGPSCHRKGAAWWAYWSTHGSALQVASLAGQLGIVQVLLRPQHALSLEHCQSALSSAARGGHVQVIQAIMKAHPDLDTVEVKGHVFLQACKYGRIEVVEMMISLGVSPIYEVEIRGDINGCIQYNGLQFAASRGHISILRFLLKLMLPIFQAEGTLFIALEAPMNLALMGGHLECVETLFHIGCFSARYWYGHISHATKHARVFHSLIRLGVDLNVASSEVGVSIGQRDMLYAVKAGREANVRVLLEAGVSPNSQNHKTHPTLLAKVYGFEHVLKTLLEFGGEDIDVGDSVFQEEFREGKIPYEKKYSVKESGDPWTKGWWGRDF